MTSSRTFLSSSEKRKRKKETEGKNEKLPKISQYSKNDNLNNEKSSEHYSKSEESDPTKSIPELADAASNTSDYTDPEHPQQGTSKNRSELYFSVNNIFAICY
ncbi:hypothetical protein WA026_005337 [Henosepilachna vigintioctopunctata]|uniref:Uncharacterized protein n=1 Tax=Henosepilachna vigintioctopunctata TaxID=420089 RepID=A0AAW1ULB6_9CUCU